VDFPFFAHHHIHLRELFQAQGWENFLSLRRTQYTTLVKHFYTHFHYKGGKITSYVKGKTISLTLNNLANILRVPRIAHHHIHFKEPWQIIVLTFYFVFDDAKGEKYMTFWGCYLLMLRDLFYVYFNLNLCLR
jgi:hypothetical protein